MPWLAVIVASDARGHYPSALAGAPWGQGTFTSPVEPRFAPVALDQVWHHPVTSSMGTGELKTQHKTRRRHTWPSSIFPTHSRHCARLRPATTVYKYGVSVGEYKACWGLILPPLCNEPNRGRPLPSRANCTGRAGSECHYQGSGPFAGQSSVYRVLLLVQQVHPRSPWPRCSLVTPQRKRSTITFMGPRVSTFARAERSTPHRMRPCPKWLHLDILRLGLPPDATFWFGLLDCRSRRYTGKSGVEVPRQQRLSPQP